MNKLEKILGYSFQNKDLLKTALTHTSYANEYRGRDVRESNQRLEFLGDAVLELIVSSYMYNCYSDFNEGRLSKFRASVVCEDTLYKIACRIELSEFLLLGVGEEKTGGRDKPSLLSDALESILGAIYLDGGMSAAERVLLENMDMREIIDTHALNYEAMDCKTKLQEESGRRKFTVVYRIIRTEGPPHDCEYTAEAELCNGDGTVINRQTGTGRSKKDAEQKAASGLLKVLKGLNDK